VILHVPHSSTRIPEEVRESIALSDGELQRELLRITDSFTVKIAVKAAEASAAVYTAFGETIHFTQRVG
jgi:hypothetical protein